MKIYRCPDCGFPVTEGYDYIWSCEGCNNYFNGAPTWLDFFVGEE